MYISTTIIENSMEVLQKITNRTMLLKIAISLLGMETKELKSALHRDICTPVFIAVLFTIGELWKQPKCP